jgi:Na+/H+ antiporter NhaC
MSHLTESMTISLERPRTVIVYALYCFVCVWLSLAIPYFGLSALSHWG